MARWSPAHPPPPPTHSLARPPARLRVTLSPPSRWRTRRLLPRAGRTAHRQLRWAAPAACAPTPTPPGRHSVVCLAQSACPAARSWRPMGLRGIWGGAAAPGIAADHHLPLPPPPRVGPRMYGCVSATAAPSDTPCAWQACEALRDSSIVLYGLQAVGVDSRLTCQQRVLAAG